jgi:hypothetical protein
MIYDTEQMEYIYVYTSTYIIVCVYLHKQTERDGHRNNLKQICLACSKTYDGLISQNVIKSWKEKNNLFCYN